MLFVYTPETVGGTIIADLPTGKYYSEELHFPEGNFVSATNTEEGNVLIKVFENMVTVKIISTIELEFKKHERDNYWFFENRI